MSAIPLVSPVGADVIRLQAAPGSPKRPSAQPGAAAAAAVSGSAASAVLSPTGGGSLPHVPRFFDPSVSLSGLSPAVLSQYAAHRAELDAFDAAIRKRAPSMADKLNGIDVVVGIPFYTEITNIISVLVTLKEVFRRRRQSALLLVIGEFARSDMVEQIPLHQLEDDEDDQDEDDQGQQQQQPQHASGNGDSQAQAQGQGQGQAGGSGSRRRTAVHIESFWKPHPKYASKPFTVRALQLLADKANSGRGAHLIIMDADIQFNHWELSAMSLMRALLDPLMALGSKDEHSAHSSQQPAKPPAGSASSSQLRGRSGSNGGSFHPQFPLRDLDRPPAASFVLLNAPRSFIADDALIHLFSYLMTFSYTGQHIHQSHGGEFSIHRQLNRSLLQDESIVYRQCYCVEAQMVCRALLEPTPDPVVGGGGGEQAQQPYGGYVLEMLMKGKWHAKINLDKLLQLDAQHNARLDLVTDKIFSDALLFAELGLHSTTGEVHGRTGGLTKTPNPDPNQQSVAVLCPVATKKEMLRAVKQYYLQLLAAQADGSLPIDSSIVQELIPQLHTKLAKLPGDKGWNHIVQQLPAEGDRRPRGVTDEQLLLFGCEEWARYTMEVLRVFRDATRSQPVDDKQRARDASRRQAAVTANRVVWLLGTLAFLNQHSDGSWGDMQHAMHTQYAPAFRRRFLEDVAGLSSSEAEDTAQRDTLPQQ